MSPFDRDFLSATPAGRHAYATAMTAAEAVIQRDLASLTGPYQGPSATDLARLIGDLDVCPEEGHGLEPTLDLVGRLILRNSIVVSDPACLGHLHCAPLIPALAAEALIAAANQSMDSWDQAPAASYLEQRVIDWLCELFGFGPAADGLFTSGGTQSNFMGLMLARDAFAEQVCGWRIQDHGLPSTSSRFRILCSEDAHFSVRQSAAILGLGQNAVVPVPVDAHRRIDVAEAANLINDLRKNGAQPIAIAATAGTTDCGAIDPLPELAALARAYGVWLHVDAAYAGALILSDRHRSKLAGINLADSIAIDFHKLFYQPISCSAFLVRDRSAFNLIRLHASYLNPESNETAGVLDLVTKSIQTTRRFDGLKPFVSLHSLGRKRIAAMIDTTIEVAQAAASLIAADPDLELALPPSLNALMLRFCPPNMTPGAVTDQRIDAINLAIQQRLLLEGHAMLARTEFRGRVFMKITLLNPRTTIANIESILARLKVFGRAALANH
ncbi:MAG TPA: aspartate aminotransferase family protein [Candidatus Binataceae bacterium]|nr:aspartate aminotransferase family protein [Candidatus Binataceae bacterium]